MDNSAFPWWKLITETDLKGGKNFEAIAFEFIQSEFPEYSWTRTQQTHDGNKDAIAVVTMFSIKDSFEEMWMEAKYSKDNIRMSRYTIDRTIVSAIVSGKVHRIIFVTNMQVSVKVREEVSKALSLDGIKCHQTLFRTKYDLEVWLTNTEKGRKVFQQYFEGLNVIDYQYKGLQVLGEMTFYEKEMNDYLYVEPVHILETQKPYTVCARIYSPCETTISINSANAQNILLIDNQNIHVGEGISDIRFCLTFQSCVQPPFTLFLASTAMTTKYIELMPVKETPQYRFKTQSQETVLRDLVSSYNEYTKLMTSKLFCIAGHEGMGKTYLLKQFLEEKALRNQFVLYYQFKYSPEENCRDLIELYLRLFYAYATIESFPKSISLIETCNEAITYVEERAYEQIASWMRNTAKYQLLPFSFCNNRIIILDNTELLTEDQKIFLHNLLSAIISSSSHSFLVVSGRLPFMGIKAHWLKFSFEDLANNISQSQLELLPARMSFLSNVINSISSLSLFWDMVQKSTDFNDFAHFVKMKTLEKVASLRIEKYIDTHDNHSKTKDLLILIYMLRSGLPYNTLMIEDTNSISELLNNNMIREGYNGYEPISSFFCECFRRTVIVIDNSSDVFLRYSAILSPDELLRIKLSGSTRSQYILEADSRSEVLMQNFDYQTIVYLLEPLFSEFSEMQSDDVTWHHLQFKYIYAKANIDSEYHIVNEFLSFSHKLEHSNKSADLYLRIYALSEVCCFQFEEADIQEALYTASEVESLVGHCHEVPQRVQEALWLCQATRILALCAVDKIKEADLLLDEAKKIWTEHDYAVTQLRYARYLFHTDLNKARALLEKSLPVLAANKDYKWEPAGRFLLGFLDYLSGNKETIQNQVETIKREFSQYASLHRSNLRLIAALKLVENHSEYDTKKEFRELWDEYTLLSETRFKKEQGQDDMIEGAYEYLWGNHDGMKQKMEAALLIFDQFGKSYKEIVQHNYSLREDIPYKRVEFYSDHSPMADDCYYLNPRFW